MYLKYAVESVVKKALRNMCFDDLGLKYLGRGEDKIDSQRLLLYDIHRKVLGKMIECKGRVCQHENQLYYLPRYARRLD